MSVTEKAEKSMPPKSYREAMTELDGIVTRLTNAKDVDVDKLVEDVTRAKTLIVYCQKKIDSAETQIKSLVKDIKADGEEEGPAGNNDEQPFAAPPSGNEEIPF